MHQRRAHLARRHVVAAAVTAALLLVGCSGNDGSSEANDALLGELRTIPGAVEVGRTSDGGSTAVTYRLEGAPPTTALEFYLASLPGEWELTAPLGDAPEVVAFCRDGALLRIDTSEAATEQTYTLTARATGAEECG